MRQFDLVIFDLDGTLIDTAEDLGNAVNHAIVQHGFPSHTKDEYKAMVGHGVRNLVTQALPEPSRDDKTVEECLQDFFPFYLSHIADFSKPYPGTQEIIRDLISEGSIPAVASNKFDEGTRKLINLFFPEIVYIIGNKEGLPLKPNPAVVEYLKKESGVVSDRIAFVGDASSDIKTASNAGIVSVAVTWGFRPESDLEGADYVAHNDIELRKYII